MFLIFILFSILTTQVLGANLDDYVFRDDGMFSWQYITSYRFEDVTLYVGNMTSQQWYNESWSNTPIWTHPIAVAIPDVLRNTEAAFAFVLGTDYNENVEFPGIPNQYAGYNLVIVTAAREMGTAVGYVADVPNQPILFVEDKEQMQRREDNQVAFTWRQFLTEDPDKPEQLNFFPMTKAASRGLTAIAELAHEKQSILNITKFGVSGGSKRGATSWLTAAVDSRVEVCVPIVYPLLNAPNSLMRHFQSLGGWSYAFGPYFNEQLTPLLTGDRAQLLAEEIDPYTFRDRLTMRKYLVAGTTDEFFFPDETQAWYDDMPQPMHLLMVANGNHVMSPRFYYVFKAIVSYWLAYLEDQTIPTMTWEFEENALNASVLVSTDPAPTQVRAYVSTTLVEGLRDFRRRSGFPENQVTLSNYRRTDVEDLGDGNYRVVVPQPEEGHWRAYFFEAQWPGVENRQIVLTTDVNIVPSEFPYPECEGITCYGKLL